MSNNHLVPSCHLFAELEHLSLRHAHYFIVVNRSSIIIFHSNILSKQTGVASNYIYFLKFKPQLFWCLEILGETFHILDCLTLSIAHPRVAIVPFTCGAHESYVKFLSISESYTKTYNRDPNPTHKHIIAR